eukprot:TRINITY_DN6180_c0_g1_i5.p1 TRINITY_DN6180_c0_g1~~TRINITY_DN6180_c0_g1_i5.p1  ORF type:complete len:505 (-),score=54.29 TRINITY_DN6180_c0_g1_i5:43-1557(-)
MLDVVLYVYFLGAIGMPLGYVPSDDCETGQCDVQLLQTGKSVRSSLSMSTHSEEQNSHPFSHRGRDFTGSSYTPYTVRANFSAGPRWIWQNELKEQVRHSPLIDDQHNIYVTTIARIRKFSSSGDLIWTWECPLEEGQLDASPALYEQSLLFYASTGPVGRTLTLFSLDLQSGTVKWRQFVQDTYSCHCDSPSVFAYNGTMVIPLASTDPSFANKSNTLYAVSTQDGAPFWKYIADEATWNFQGSTPGDGTILFGSQCGRAYRITFGGALVWKSGPTPSTTPGVKCSTGGGALGPNGVFYVNSNHFADPTGGAYVDAYRVSDGTLLWSKKFDARHQGWQYPAVGKLGPGGPLAVVAPVGGITSFQQKVLEGDLQLLNAVVALDAATGEELWRVEEAPWPNAVAAGDEDQLQIERAVNKKDPRSELFCLPDIQGIPLLAGDGTVYASSSHNGDLRAIRDTNGNGKIEPGEVSVFSTKQCFLNSPSLARGMLVAAPCWGPMYVFKE